MATKQRITNQDPVRLLSTVIEGDAYPEVEIWEDDAFVYQIHAASGWSRKASKTGVNDFGPWEKPPKDKFVKAPVTFDPPKVDPKVDQPVVTPAPITATVTFDPGVE